MLIRQSEYPQDAAALQVIAKQSDNPHVRSAVNVWTRFGNWQKNPMLLAIQESSNELMGFVAFTINKNQYGNLYYIVVSNQHQRKGVGMTLWKAMLMKLQKSGKIRLKFSSDVRYSGYQFFTSKIGLKSKFTEGNNAKFDLLLVEVMGK